MDHIQTVKIHDVEDDEIYTAKIQKNGKRWMGWIQEHPKVKCEADTQDTLLQTLEIGGGKDGPYPNCQNS